MIHYHNGDKFEGSWDDDKINEHGILYYNNGDKYDGTWENDMKNGKGK